MRVYTNIKVLKRVWEILKELGIEGLLLGGELKIDIEKLLDKLLIEGKLNDLCSEITQKEEDFEEYELKEVIKILSDFFSGIGESLDVFRGIVVRKEGGS